MEGGTRFVDPDHVRAGWRLRMPPTTDGRAERAAPAGQRRGVGPDNGDRLPELVALGMGSLACAALSRRARSRRRIDPFTGDLELQRVVSEEAMDAAALLHRFAGVPALHSFETANCLLGSSLCGRPHRPGGARHPRLPIRCHVLADRAQGRRLPMGSCCGTTAGVARGPHGARGRGHPVSLRPYRTPYR